jgi:predicted pyridoxine 5'-phosphate oxidase superfamily flavin-nucleotide-binding protein
MSEYIHGVAALEAALGETPAAMHLKVIDHLDAGALRWIAESPFAFLGFGGDGGVTTTLAGGDAGFASGDAAVLRIPTEMIDDPALARVGAPFGALFVLPGVGETLRVNGRIAAVGDALSVTVEECYGHCAKALIRSDFWIAQPGVAPEEPARFVTAARLIGLATLGNQGHADLSPKGDPAGAMVQLDGDVAWFADRPGNRRIDSFRNIVVQPRIAMAMLVPGATVAGILRGSARLTTDMAARERFTVQGKVPQVAIRVDVDALDIAPSLALGRARLWPLTGTSEIRPAKLFVEHIKLNKTGGVAASLARASLMVPGATGLVQQGLDKDYRENLY